MYRTYFQLLIAFTVSFCVRVNAEESASNPNEIIVTATKRDETLQQVPASISALSGQALEARHIQTIESLAHAMPNIAYANVAAVVPVLSIRGVSPDGSAPIMEGTVALHVDGVYQPRMNMLELVLADLQSAEVLRGPQGTLYGRNANAGVVSLNTRRPTGEREAAISVSVGSHGREGVRGYVSSPISPTLGIRVSGLFDQSDGYGRNLLTNSEIDGFKNVGGRASLRWEPDDQVTADLIGSYSRVVQSRPFYIGNPYGMQPGSNYTRLLASGADGRYSLRPYEVYNNFEPRQTAEQEAATLIVNWDVRPDVAVKSITGYQDFRYDSLQDHDGTPTTWIVAASRANSRTFSQEINLTATLAGADVVAGSYFLDDDLDGGVVVEISPGNPFGAGATPGLLTTALISQRSRSAALFADVTYPIGDRLRLLAGVRRTHDRRETTQRIEAAINGSFSMRGTPITGCSLDHAVPDIEFNSTTGKAGAQFDIASHLLGYVTWQSGFKAGAYSFSLCDNQFLPEEVSSWEVGLRSRLFENALTLNITGFIYDYTNMQLARTINPTPTTISNVVDNASSAKLWGGEIEAVAQLGEVWRVDFAVGHVSSEYGFLEARNGAAPGNPNVDLTGNQLPRAPEWTLNGGVEFTSNLGTLGDLAIRAQYDYVSETFFTPFNERIARQGGYGLLNAMASFRPANSKLLLRVVGKNLTDESYFNGLFTSAISNNGRGSYGMPRTWSLEFTRSF